MIEEIFNAAKKIDFNVIKKYLAEGGNINVKNDADKTLLQVAIEEINFNESENLELADNFILFLIDSGVELTYRNGCDDLYENGSLLHATYLLELKNSFALLLLNPAIDINITADDSTSSNGWFGVDIPTKNIVVGEVVMYRYFIQAYYLENATVFHYACLKGDINTVKLILNKFGKNVLSLNVNLVLNKSLEDTVSSENLSDNENSDSETQKESYEVGVEDLGMGWAAREPWPIRRVKWVTPLHLAARSGRLDIVELLIQEGANHALLDGEGYSPSDYVKFGIEDFEYSYESILTNYGDIEPISSANASTIIEVKKAREKTLDREMCVLKREFGDPEERIAAYKKIIDFLSIFSLAKIDLSDNKKQVRIQKTSDLAIADFEIQRQIEVEKSFFDFSKQKKYQIKQLQINFSDNRYGKSKSPLTITDIPARRLITADVSSVEESIQKSGGVMQLRTQGNIQKNLKWPFKTSTYGDSYAWHELRHDNSKFIYTHKPVPGHLGGFFMPILPKKNSYSDIIGFINEFTQEDIYRERFLARCMIFFSNSGQPFPKVAFRQMGINLTNDQYELLTKICYLTSVKEITRRMATGQRSDGSEVKVLPFALAHARALKLIREGYLHMNQVFSEDAEFGLPTGKSITTSSYEESLEKVRKINALYTKYREWVNSNKRYITVNESSSEKEMKQELLDTYGGYGDSDDEESCKEASSSQVLKK